MQYDNTKYFDKYPLKNYAYGPSGSGIAQVQPYQVQWSGEFSPGRGIDLYSNSNHYFYPETSFADSKYFSFCFDQSTNYWFGYSTDSIINVSYVSGNSKTNYTFAGFSPQMFHNSILKTGVVDAYCFYAKGDSNVYFKRASENFGVERVAYSGDRTIRRLHTVRKLDDFYYRYGIYYMDNEGDGHKVISHKFKPMVDFKFANFEDEPTGEISYLRTFEVENEFSSGYFLTRDLMSSDNFETTPSGTINSLTSGNNMLAGYFI